MTITLNNSTGKITLAHAGNTRIVRERDLRHLADLLGWGDVEAHINAAKQNPGIAITVDNTSRVRAPFNARVCAILQ